MRETRADTTQAVVLAVLLHAFLFALMFAGLWWTRDAAPLSAAGSPISAEMVDTSDLSAQMRRALARRPEPIKQPVPEPPQPVEEDVVPLPQPIPEPSPQDAQVPQQRQAQEVVPVPDTIEQEKVDRAAISAEKREREQEEKRRQEQIDLTERERQQDAEKQQRLAQQQRDDELKKIRAEQAKVKRQVDLAEQQLKQIADLKAAQASNQAAASASPPLGNNGVDKGLQAQYQLAIQRAVESNWNRPDNIPAGAPCKLVIIQLPGGQVMSATVDPSCPYDEQGRRSVEAAVLKAQPLPYAGFESVFNRKLNFTFRPPN